MIVKRKDKVIYSVTNIVKTDDGYLLYLTDDHILNNGDFSDNKHFIVVKKEGDTGAMRIIRTELGQHSVIGVGDVFKTIVKETEIDVDVDLETLMAAQAGLIKSGNLPNRWVSDGGSSYRWTRLGFEKINDTDRYIEDILRHRGNLFSNTVVGGERGFISKINRYKTDE